MRVDRRPSEAPAGRRPFTGDAPAGWLESWLPVAPNRTLVSELTAPLGPVEDAEDVEPGAGRAVGRPYDGEDGGDRAFVAVSEHGEVEVPVGQYMSTPNMSRRLT